MTKINYATQSYAQIHVGFQLHGQIYYRVTQDIVNGAELLVYYGQEYAKELGINVARKITGPKVPNVRFATSSSRTKWRCICTWTPAVTMPSW